MEATRTDIGRYRVIAQLGQGGTANVSLAVARGPGDFSKLVVLKRLKAQLASEPGFAKMFMNEARLAARLNHPNIVQTNEIFSDDDVPVIVMQYLEGQSLAEVAARERSLAKSSRSLLAQQLWIISEALSGLHYSHELCDYDGTPLNVVHRDMTPHNIFITFDGQVKILDFGIAKLRDSSVETDTGVIKGKLRYIPAEQIMGEALDKRADIYSVGVMLWEAASGKKMWSGLSDATIMNRAINGEIPKLTDEKLDLPQELTAIIERCLALAPEERYPTAAALQEALDSFRSSLTEVVHSKDVGRGIASLFEDVRCKTKELIEIQLTAAQAAEHPGPTEAARHTDDSYVLSAPDSLQPGPKKRQRGWLAAGVGTALALALWLSQGTGRAPSASGGQPKPSNDSAAQQQIGVVQETENKKTHHTIRITAFPSVAQIHINGMPVVGNPYTAELPQSTKTHQLKITAPGHLPKLSSFTATKDSDLVVRLTKRPENEAQKEKLKSSGVRPAPPVKNPQAATQRGGATADCDPAFVIDTRGIKRFKPHCIN